MRHTTSAATALEDVLRAGMADAVGFSISGIESQADGTHGLLEMAHMGELSQPGVGAAAETVSWLTEDYHFELNDSSVQVRVTIALGELNLTECFP